MRRAYGTRVRSWTGAALVVAGFAAAAVPCRGDEELLARGRAVYGEQCILCHGKDGRGDGDAAYLLVVPPRDFHAGRFRFVSTWERVPSDDDLLRAITYGLPGTQMPSHTALSEEDRRALVAVVKSLAEKPWTIQPSRSPGTDGTPGTGVVVVPPEPADARTNHARAEELFREACATCHGATGHGDGRTDLVTDEGYRIRPRDFTRGVFKGDASPAGLYRRIVIGIPGTPMPSNDWAYGDDAWYLVYYVLSLGQRGGLGSGR
jgi:cytochrome c oxidase cbb3-type subunit I/II